MAVGNLFPSESTIFEDSTTGRPIRQVTNHPSIHHHPFYYIPAFDREMQRLIFISHRTGRPEIFAELRGTGRLLQVTNHPGLAEWSIHPSGDGQYVYFTDRIGAWRVNLDTFREECLAEFPGAEMREAGMVGAAMGTTALSADDHWWAVPVKDGRVARFVIINTRTGANRVILERDSIGHPQFHPDDSSLLRYAGPYSERIWIINRNGQGNRLAYRRNEKKKEWIVHETWLPGTRDLLTVNWPHGILRIGVDSGEIHPILQFNAWHPMVNRRGTIVVTDTTWPDSGIWIFALNDKRPQPKLLCQSLATNCGVHWHTDHCPYDDGPVTVDAPQHTHPHPNFAPDDSVVVFTSDRSGFAQIYECQLDSDVI